MFDPVLAFVLNGSRLEWLDIPAAFGLFVFVLFVYFSLVWFWPYTVGQLFFWFWTHTIYRLKVVGIENVPMTGPVLLVCNHTSYVDWVFLVRACPRRVRIVVWTGYRRNPIWYYWLSLIHTIPIESRNPTTGGLRDAFARIRKALDGGDMVLIFPEGRLTRNGFMRPFQRGLELIARNAKAPIVPVCLVNTWGSIFSHAHGKIVWKWPDSLPRRVSLGFGPPLPPDTPAAVVRRHVQRVGARVARDADHWSKPVHRRFVRVAARHPFRTCWIDPMNKRELNYGKALAGAWCLREWLRPRLGSESMVGLWIPTSMGGALTNVAVTLLGKVAVNLNYTASAEALQSAVRQTGIKQVLTSKLAIRKVPLPIPAHEAPADGEKVQIIYLEDALASIKNWQRLLAFLKVLLLPGWILEYVSLGLGRHKLEDLLTIVFTSGSTGEPKGVMLSHRNIACNIDSIIAVIDLVPRDRALSVLPFFHSFGYTIMLWGPPCIGASVVYYPDPRAAKEIGEICKSHRCNLMISTATFLRFYLKRAEADDFRGLRLLVCGAEKLPQTISHDFNEKFGVLPYEGYGCTELSPVVSSNVPDRGTYGVTQVGNKPGTIGQPLPGIAAKIVDPETFEELPSDQDGLLLVTGGNVMVGYLGKPEKTVEVIRDGWYITGDIGRVDDDGFLTLTGRLTRFAKIGGEMVPLEKIEDELHVAAATEDRIFGVTAVPDTARGERMVVLYLSTTGIDIRQVCQKIGETNLPNLWLPKERDFYPVNELPLLGTGKLDLRRLKQIALEITAK